LRSRTLPDRLSRMLKTPLKAHVFVALLLGVLVVAGYGIIVNLGFVSDDYAIIRLITLPEAALNWNSVLNDFYTEHLKGIPLYRPLYTLSYGVDFALWGTWPLPYHLLNLALHLASSFFVYLLALELVPGERRWEVAVTAGALFALQPVHPEAVTWIAGRVDTICAVFYFPALFFFLRWLRTEERRHLILSLASFVLALASKEMAVILPALLFLIVLYQRRSLVGTLLKSAPFVVVFAVYLAFRTYILWGLKPYAAIGKKLQIFDSIVGTSYRTLHMFFPLNFGLLPGGWQGFGEVVMVLIAVALAALTFVAYRRGWIEGWFTLLILALYTVSLAPVFKALKPDPMFTGSRWLYIPSAFLCIFIAYLLWSALGGRARWAWVGSAAVCAVFLVVLLANQMPWLRAAEISERHLKTGEDPGLNLKYDGVHVFGARITWLSANMPPFKEQQNSPKSP
jgi:hypothetical protein